MEKSKIALIGLSAALGIALLISFRSCNGWKQQAEDAGDYITSSKDTITYLRDSAIAQRKALVANEALFKEVIKDREDLAQALKEAKVKIKNLQSISTVVTHSTIQPGGDSIQIKYEKIPCDDFTPVPFSVDSQYYSIAGKIHDDHIIINRLDFPDSLHLIMFTETHLFRRNENRVSAQHSNKYLRVTGLEAHILREEKKWWDRRAYYIAAGLVGGYFLFR